jgi:translation initiation factor 1
MPGLFDGTPLERPVTCEHCGGGAGSCACPRDASGLACPPSVQHPRVRREKRRGKWNTIVAGVSASPGGGPGSTDRPGDLSPLLRSLKAMLGTGGGLADPPDRGGGGQEIVLQGDHRDAVVGHLKSLGYHAKPAGG